MSTIRLDGRTLTRADVVAVACDGARVELDGAAMERVERAAAFVQRIVDEDRTAYGINTGFGRNADRRLRDVAAARLLQRNLIITHAACVGDPLPTEVVRAMMVLRINTLLGGHSGVRVTTLAALVTLLHERVHPIVPEKGSVGASGDLAPLSHVVLPLLGEGEVDHDGTRRPATEALAAVGLTPLELTYKEGLALNNGTQQMGAHAVLALHRLEHLVDVADLTCALALEAAAGRSDAFDPAVHALRPHPGQVRSAAAIRAWTEGSGLLDLPAGVVNQAVGWEAKNPSPQDCYSLRCAPAVHGAVRDALAHAARVVDVELNSVTDNPILLPEQDRVISAGNFHGMPLALAMSAVKAAIPVLASISERRLAMLVDGATNGGLPTFLVHNADGAQSGHMLLQYTAAALVNDLATRAHPAPTINVPTCANTEDQVSMGANEARHVHEMCEDLECVLALELLGASQALDIRRRQLAGAWPPEEGAAEGLADAAVGPAPATAGVLARVRRDVALLVTDRTLGPDIAAVIALVRGRDLLSNSAGA